jgi:hypothetical protein
MIPVANTGLDHHLQQHGHTVTNISAGSAGNFGQLRHAYWTLKECADYDFIVWFHTESLRDIIEICMQDPEEAKTQFPLFTIDVDFNRALDYIDEQNYAYAQQIYQEFGIPFIVVDGQSPFNRRLGKDHFVKHHIKWLEQLLELNSDAPRYSFGAWQKIQQILEHYSINEREFVIKNLEDLDRSELVIKLGKQSDLFPDNGHPSSDCFRELADQIELLG